MIKLINKKEADREERLAKAKEELEKKKEMLINTNVFEDQLFLDKEIERIQDIIKVNDSKMDIKKEIIKDIIDQEIKCKKMLFNNDAAIYLYYSILFKSFEMGEKGKKDYTETLDKIRSVLEWEENKKEYSQKAETEKEKSL